MNKAEQRKYNEVLRMVVNFQAKANAAGAVVFIDGEPAKTKPFYYVTESDIGIDYEINGSNREYLYDCRFWNDSIRGIKDDFKVRFTLWKQIK